MERNGVVNFHHRRSPSSDRFLDVFSPPPSENALRGSAYSSAAGDELNEDDVFWTGEDFSEVHRRTKSPEKNHLRQTFRQPEKFGILAALPEDIRKLDRSVLYRKPSIISSSPPFAKPPVSSPSGMPSASRAIPKPPAERDSSSNFVQSMPARKFQHSAPLNIPMMPRKPPKNGDLAEVEIDNDGDDEMLPPHEIVARGSANSSKTTFSVLEGVGRTLKGRDLRQVRNAIWRQTGFLD